jgi:Domain of unknown function (DUF6457)
MSRLQRWIAAAGAELSVDPADVDERTVLDLARCVAHDVDRPAAPVTAFILGIAVGRGSAAADAASRLTGLARSWAQEHPPA